MARALYLLNRCGTITAVRTLILFIILRRYIYFLYVDLGCNKTDFWFTCVISIYEQEGNNRGWTSRCILVFWSANYNSSHKILLKPSQYPGHQVQTPTTKGGDRAFPLGLVWRGPGSRYPVSLCITCKEMYWS